MSKQAVGKKVLLVVPKARAVRGTAGTIQRALKRDSLRIGTLDNNKANAEPLLHFIVESIKAALPVQSVVALKKTIVGMAAPAAILDQLAAEADFVIGAMAD